MFIFQIFPLSADTWHVTKQPWHEEHGAEVRSQEEDSLVTSNKCLAPGSCPDIFWRVNTLFTLEGMSGVHRPTDPSVNLCETELGNYQSWRQLTVLSRADTGDKPGENSASASIRPTLSTGPGAVLTSDTRHADPATWLNVIWMSMQGKKSRYYYGFLLIHW